MGGGENCWGLENYKFAITTDNAFLNMENSIDFYVDSEDWLLTRCF